MKIFPRLPVLFEICKGHLRNISISEKLFISLSLSNSLAFRSENYFHIKNKEQVLLPYRFMLK